MGLGFRAMGLRRVYGLGFSQGASMMASASACNFVKLRKIQLAYPKVFADFPGEWCSLSGYSSPQQRVPV